MLKKGSHSSMALGIIVIGIVAMAVAVQKGLLPFGLVSSGKYLIVIPDEFSGDQTLQSYVNARGASYSVEVATMSHILSNRTYNNNQNYLMISSVSSIQCNGIVDIVWYDGTYHVYATNYAGFHQVSSSATPQKAIIWVWTPCTDVKITYNTGQTIDVPLNGGYVNFGLHYILTNGNIYTYSGPEMAIHDYVVQQGANYVTLIGDLNKIPSWQLPAVGTNCTSLDIGVTDRPYAYSNLNMVITNAPNINVGRVPVTSIQEMESYLTRDIGYVPHQSNRAYAEMGIGLGDYASWATRIIASINSAYPNEIVTVEWNPDTMGICNEINQYQYDNIVIFAHGGYDTAGSIAGNSLNYITNHASSIILAVACESADFSRISHTGRCLGEEVINDQRSNFVGYIGGTIYLWSDDSILFNYYNSISAGYGTLGSVFSNAISGVTIDQQKFALELFGDPTLIVSDASPPVPTLQGVWSINNIPVTSPSATLYFNTTALTFKFVKTLGTSDSSISCYVIENGETLATLAYQGSSTWTGTVNFAGGTHILTLRATDGTHTVTMTLTSS